MNVSPHLVSMGCAVIYLGISSVSVRKDGQVDTVIKVKPLFTAGKNSNNSKLLYGLHYLKRWMKLIIIHVVWFFHVDVDECLSNPCQNGGTCIDNSGSHSCICLAGWTGQNCTIGKIERDSKL